jgi:membrane protease YdiL (CAAX protease family)
MPILTLTEELGWRGYLHYLWRPAGFWRASLATGAIWGFWHAPIIYLFGLNYPTERPLGIGLFVIYCMLLAPIMTLVRDRAGTVWAAGLAHGTINAVAGLTIVSLSNPAFPWNGMVGIGGFIALALAVAAIALLARPKPELIASA